MAKDIYHDIVKNALQKDNWVITHDPYKIPLSKRTLKADLGAEKVLGAERGSQKIVIEVKSFLRDSFIYDFHEAYGQYMLYRRFIKNLDPDRDIYLAVPENVFIEEFSDPDIEWLCKTEHIKVIVFDADNQLIIEWKDQWKKSKNTKK
jgi:XisH protein